MRTYALVVGLCVVALLPFASKAIHIDDPLFIWSARQIQQQPLDYFGFDANWDGTLRPMSQVMHNPPGFSYALAGWCRLFGWSETSLHTLVFLLAALAAAGTYTLARELCPRPVEATLIAIFSPVFLVSATTVMSDIAMLCFWLWAIALWIGGLRHGDARRLAAATLCVTLAIATKYFAVALIPLLAIHALQCRERARRACLWLTIPIALLALFEWHSATLYGQGLIARAASAAGEMRSVESLLERSLIGFSFVGGNLIMLLAYAGHLWRRRTLSTGAVALAAIAGALIYVGELGGHALADESGPRWGLVAQVALFATCGLTLPILTAVELRRRRDPSSILLALWILGTLLYALFLFHWPASRTLLPLAPAVALLIARRPASSDAHPTTPRTAPSDAHTTERPAAAVPDRPKTGQLGPTLASILRSWPVAALALLSLTVAWSDRAAADGARTAAGRIMDRLQSERGHVWFMGHWGFQHYMEQRGASAIDWTQSPIRAGDFVVLPINNTNVRIFDQALVGEAMTLEQPASSWSATMSREFGAGFYSGLWGPIPYGFGRVPPDYYQVLRIRGR